MTILILLILGGVAAVALGIYIGLVYFSPRRVEIEIEDVEAGEAFPRSAARQGAPLGRVSRMMGIRTRQVRRNAFRFSSREDTTSRDRQGGT